MSCATPSSTLVIKPLITANKEFYLRGGLLILDTALVGGEFSIRNGVTIPSGVLTGGSIV